MLHTHPAVAQAQVVGVPEPRLMEVPAAYVVLRGGAAATPDELIAWCRERLAGFRVPRHVRIVDGFEHIGMTGSAKVQKSRLREFAIGDLGLAERTPDGTDNGGNDGPRAARRGPALGAAAGLITPPPGAGPGLSSRLVRVVIPFAPGGEMPISHNRPVLEKLQERFGVGFVLDNRGGAGSAIGTAMVAAAAPDGYTLLSTTASFVTAPPVVRRNALPGRLV